MIWTGPLHAVYHELRIFLDLLLQGFDVFLVIGENFPTGISQITSKGIQDTLLVRLEPAKIQGGHYFFRGLLFYKSVDNDPGVLPGQIRKNRGKLNVRLFQSFRTTIFDSLKIPNEIDSSSFQATILSILLGGNKRAIGCAQETNRGKPGSIFGIRLVATQCLNMTGIDHINGESSISQSPCKRFPINASTFHSDDFRLPRFYPRTHIPDILVEGSEALFFFLQFAITIFEHGMTHK